MHFLVNLYFHSQPWARSDLLSISIDLPYLDTSRKWTHSVCFFLCSFFLFLVWFPVPEVWRVVVSLPVLTLEHSFPMKITPPPTYGFSSPIIQKWPLLTMPIILCVYCPCVVITCFWLSFFQNYLWESMQINANS